MDPRKKEVAQGASAGVLAAIVMGLVWMIVSAARGAGFFTPLSLIGATFLGGGWATHAIAAAIVGTLLHLFTGACLGAIFGWLARDVDPMSSRLAAGVAYGSGVFLVMTFLVLPWANPVLFYGVDKGLYFIVHLIYGLTLPIAMLHRKVRVERPAMHPHRPYA